VSSQPFSPSSLADSAGVISIAKDVEWLIGQNFDCVSLKIMAKLPETHNDCVANLFNLRVILLGSCQDLRYKIYREQLIHCFAVFHEFFLDNKAPLTAECMAEMYKMRGCHYSRLDNVGRCSRYCLRSLKSFCCSGPQSTLAELLSIVNNGKLRSTSFAMKRFRDAIRPVSFWTCFLLYGGCI
jgi:hypothetical protein